MIRSPSATNKQKTITIVVGLVATRIETLQGPESEMQLFNCHHHAADKHFKQLTRVFVPNHRALNPIYQASHNEVNSNNLFVASGESGS